MIPFKNTWSDLPEKFYQRIMPEEFSRPELLHFNEELASELGIDFTGVTDEELAQIFSGQKILPGSEPMALAYAGFQFGHPSPQLGDGRAHLLGEAAGHDIQLKGSGRTRFSRSGDGRSALGPVIREYIVSEAMHRLGVPTTRALAAVATGEAVPRQYGMEPGGIFTRVANSHLRVGTFQYFFFQNDLEALETLLNYAIKRHYPELSSLSNNQEKIIALLKALMAKQSDLVAKWSELGFIHGVMNTDNFSLAGITIDYGPCAFMDEFKWNKVFSSIDQQGRYSFNNQIPIAQWNIYRLADALLPLMGEDLEKNAQRVTEALTPQLAQFEDKRWRAWAKKLGIIDYKNEDQKLIQIFLDYLEEEELDFTLAFRNLPDLYHEQTNFYPQSNELRKFLKQWIARVDNVDHLNEINPLYIPRNHQIERAIDRAYEGDLSVMNELMAVLKNPFQKNDELHHYHIPPKPEERVCKTFCGT
jgi:uncharacterized protein YdiU (UPF0061 family)